MNLRKTCPDIPDDWKGGMSDVCKILGESSPISPKTIKRRMKLGLIQPERDSNNKLRFTGAEVKRLWTIF